MILLILFFVVTATASNDEVFLGRKGGWLEVFFVAKFYTDKDLRCYHNCIMPHCLLLPQRLFIVTTHVGVILFVIAFRIVDADSSNCDFTIRFLIRVHGLPPGSFNPSSVIVLVRNLETGKSFEQANQPTPSDELTYVGTNEPTRPRTN